MSDYHFYGSWPSYYSAKGRAYFQYKRLPYVHHGASATEYQNVILGRTGKMFIPVVITPDDEVLQDTCDIIDELERRHPERPVLPDDGLLRFASTLMEYYADECLIYPGLNLRWHHGDENIEWTLQEFERAATPREGDATISVRSFAKAIQGYAAGIGMADEPSKDAARRVFDRLMTQLEAHLRRHQFLLGATPSLGDIALMGPIFGHFYRDAYSSKILRESFPRVCIWVEDMNLSNATAADRGWELTESAMKIFGEIGAGFGVFLRDTADTFDRILPDLEPGKQVDRVFTPGLDTHIFETPVHVDILNSYWAYKQQRVRDAYQASSAIERERIDRFLKDIGCTGTFERSVSWRLVKNAEGWLVSTSPA